MMNLIRNENMKIYKRTGTKVMFGILIIVVLLIGLVMRFTEEATETQSEAEMDVSIESTELMDDADQLPPQVIEQQELQEYREEEGITEIPTNSMVGFTMQNPQLISFVTMFSVIVGAGIVASEHSNGTIKLLMIRPVKRWKILFSKWIATIQFSIVMLFVLILSSLITGGVLHDFSIESTRVVDMTTDGIRDLNVWQYMGTAYFLGWIELVIMTTFAFMLGAVFRNQSLSIGLSLVLLFTGGQVVYLLSNYEWAKYILFANSNLLQHFYGQPMIPELSIAFSAMVILVYFILFKAIAYISFAKRDIAD
ncbi:ABC transporter permease subunit [Salisediminibacterium beveridgei]|uniref:ABC transporter, permease protein n=1 Tax=Salisediminibacterium beveridgei TaxID=632773 RepID=A0A1D7QVL1_9BACI|nr:ABC transporter permease subunit [Salisediminibacterium beveridgei]AOM83052.1 ABC transporter, permease protein [Salisediminibacterium beveridgei]